jgi:hypothetical protein
VRQKIFMVTSLKGDCAETGNMLQPIGGIKRLMRKKYSANTGPTAAPMDSNPGSREQGLPLSGVVG